MDVVPAAADWIEAQLPLRLVGPPTIREEAVLATWPGQRPLHVALLLGQEPLGVLSIGLLADPTTPGTTVFEMSTMRTAVRVDLPGSWHAWSAALDTIGAWAEALGAARVEVDVDSREIARLLGEREFRHAMGFRHVRHLRAQPTTGIDDAEELARAVSAAARSTAAVVAGRRRSLLGGSHERRLEVTYRNGGTVKVRLPAAGAVLAEPVAATIDELSGLRRRFPATRIDLLAFEGSAELAANGTAVLGFVHYGQPRELHLAAGYVLAEAATARGRRIAGLRSVVAHEFWHVVERDLEVSDYRSHLELRRAVGAVFGVETFQHLYDGGARNRDHAVSAAYSRLGVELGPYAQTTPAEGFAELFARWWCDPSPPASVRAFGSLLERFLPTPPTFDTPPDHTGPGQRPG